MVKRADTILGVIGRSVASSLRGDDRSTLLSTGETHLGYSVLGLPVQDRHGVTGERSVQGHQGDEGTGSSVT